MRTYLLLFIVLALSFITVIFYSCKKSGGGKSFFLSGTVVDETNSPVMSAAVTVGSSSVTTAGDGTFKLANVSSGQASFQIQVDAPGFFTQYKNVDNIDGSSLNTQVVLVQKSSLGTLNATAGGSIGATGLRVIAPANAFATTTGGAYTGPVTVSARYITKTNTNIATAMPGGDFTATDANGNNGGMRTYGFVATQFTDAAGNTLTPNANVKVAVTLPTGVTNPTTQGGQAWAYNNTAGKWNTPAPLTVTGPEYFLPCTTLYQNIDLFVPIGTLTGKVTCPSGSPASFVTVTIQSPYDKYVTTTNENGNFRARVEATGNWIYTVTADGSNFLTVGPVPANNTTTVSGLTVTQCTDNNNNGGGGGAGSGKWTFNGSSYGKYCSSVPDVSGCSGIDAAILDQSGNSFTIYNMPQGSSGTYSFTDGYSNIGSCSLFGLTSYVNGTQYATKSGSVTKTGAKSFTLSCTVYDILSNATYTVTGSGNY